MPVAGVESINRTKMSTLCHSTKKYRTSLAFSGIRLCTLAPCGRAVSEADRGYSIRTFSGSINRSKSGRS